MIKDFKLTQVTYHRNGIAGRPFHAVHFTCADSSVPLIAIIPETPQDGECFVVSPESPVECWRGDRFEAQAREALLVHKAEQDARWEARFASDKRLKK